MSAEHLSSIHTALIDAREGYRKAIEKAEDPNLVNIFRSIDGLHAAAHEDIHRLLAAHGEQPDESGSVMGTVHSAVVAVRSAVVGLDDGSLESFASGEERNLETYDEAIDGESDETARAALVRHREALAAKVVEMKQQADQSS